MGVSSVSLYSWMSEKYIYTGISIYVHLGLCLGVCVYVLAHAGSVSTQPASRSFSTRRHYQ